VIEENQQVEQTLEEQTSDVQTPEEQIQNELEQEVDLSDALGAIPNITFNRKLRRAMLKQSGYVKLKNRLGYKDWFENVKNNVQNGKQLHTSNTEDVIRRSREFLDKSNESTAAFLVERGYSEEEVSNIIERNIEIQDKISMKKLKS
jgi:hypothetical protein